MAVGDRIGSARTAGFMRRINALEDARTYGSLGSVTRFIPNFTTSPYSIGSGGGYTAYIKVPRIRDGYCYFTSHSDAYCIYRSAFPLVEDAGVGIIPAANSPSDTAVFGMRGWDVQDGKIVVAMIHPASSTTSGDNEYLIRTYSTGGAVIQNYTTWTDDFAVDDPTYQYTLPYILSSGDIVSLATKKVVGGSLSYGLMDVELDTWTEETAEVNIGNNDPMLQLPGDELLMGKNVAGETSELLHIDATLTPGASQTYPESLITARCFGFDAFGNSCWVGSTIASPASVELYIYNSALQRIATICGLGLGGQSSFTGCFDDANNFVNDVTRSTTTNTFRQMTNTSTQTIFKRYPNRGSAAGGVSLGTPDLGLTVPSDSSLVGYRPHYKEVLDMLEAIETVAILYGVKVDSGQTTTTTSNQLIDSGQLFVAEGTAAVGDIVYNITDCTYANVTTVSSNTTLLLDADIMVNTDYYEIINPWAVTGSRHNIFDNISSGLEDWTFLPSTGVRIKDNHYAEIGTILAVLELARVI